MITTKLENNTLWIGLNNPEKANAITIKMIDCLEEEIHAADSNDEVRVVVIYGEGKAFCAGGDLKAMEEKSGMFAGESFELKQRYQKGIQRIPNLLENFNKPLIAMVNGPAIGAGCDLACMCDLRIASQTARFGETFSKLNLVPGDGGTYFLSRAIGYTKAMEMFLTGDLYSAKEAMEMGLVYRVVQPERLVHEVEALAQKIVKNSPAALRLTKSALKKASRQSLDEQLDLLSSSQAIVQRMEEHFTALKALKDNR